MKVLITGGMGVIGSEISRRFVKEGYRPVIYARHRDNSLIADIQDDIDVELGDILDLPRLLDTVKRQKITHIVHAAGFVGAVSAQNPALSVQVNVMGMVNVLEAARLFDIQRVVYTSAKGVYGDVSGEFAHPNYKPLPEDYPKNPTRIYDAAKLMSEHTALYYHKHMGVDVVVLRFATTYGPGKTARHGAMGATSRIVEHPFNRLPFKIEVGGDQRDDFIYNKDSALGVFRACTAKDPKSRIYNIGSGVGATLNDFRHILLEHLPDAEIEIGSGLNYMNLPFSTYSIYEISRAREELGYSPEYDLKRGIADYLDTLARLKARETGRSHV
jgi:UDP-glucose 4-epimerase